MIMFKASWFYPFYKGRGRLALAKVKAEPFNKLVPVSHRLGPAIFVFQKDYIGQMIILFGDLDPTVSAIVSRNLSQGDVLVDIGANLGVVSLPAAAKVGITGKILAIEPNKRCTQALALSKKENDFQNLIIINSALMDFEGDARIDIPLNSLGQARISVEPTHISQACNVTTLDKIKITYKLKKIRLLKIDVEGNEYRVLLGSSHILESRDVDIIVFESHPSRGAFARRDEVVLLTRKGYDIYEIIKRPMLALKLKKTSPAYDPEGSEFVAVRNDLEVDIKRGIVAT